MQSKVSTFKNIITNSIHHPNFLDESSKHEHVPMNKNKKIPLQAIEGFNFRGYNNNKPDISRIEQGLGDQNV